MELITRIHQFIDQPFPLWETTLTHHLAQHQWEELKEKGFAGSDDYSTARVWLNEPSLKLDKRKKLSENNLFVEFHSSQLQSFYAKHGLELLSEEEIEANTALLKINDALSILRQIEPAYNCVTELVQSIHLLRQPDAEIDLSYSHPQIPFSIFLSVCEDNSVISNLRVAESILHEAMHLKLTLIENSVPLIKLNTNNLYYSPWRNEQRPVPGVLHGLFVFRAICDFYLSWIKKNESVEIEKFLNCRIENIRLEISSLEDFYKHTSLTEKGKLLTAELYQPYP